MTALIIIAVLEVCGLAAWMYFTVAQRRHLMRGVTQRLEEQQNHRLELKQEVETLYSSMVDVGSLRRAAEELISTQEALKAERGRIMITQAELETVEARLRELEEIDRELEASGVETKQELEILRKKHEDLSTKNNALREQISFTMQQLDSIMGEIEMSSQMSEQVEMMKSEILQTQGKIDTLLLEIEQGNEQYYTLKRRYDALDIEYAQLYEKFSDVELAKG